MQIDTEDELTTPPQPDPAPAPSSPPTRSLILTGLIALFGLVAVAGLVIAILGIGGVSVIEIELGDFKLKTQATGFGAAAIALLGIVAILKFAPSGTTVFSGASYEASINRRSGLLAIAGVVLLVIAIIVALLTQ